MKISSHEIGKFSSVDGVEGVGVTDSISDDDI